MKWVRIQTLALAAALLLAGCGIPDRRGLDAGRLQQLGSALREGAPRLSPELEAQILALDPGRVTADDVRDVLAHAPAPRIINIHGGIAWVVPRMVSFSEFLAGLGYPSGSLTNPGDGTYSFSCYESSRKIAGVIAWYYEREGLRPMLVGHSQGGMQAVKVLYRLAAPPSSSLRVWNPLTWEEEPRCEILDPLDGRLRPVVGLQLPFATAVGAGGLTRLLPNQWDMTGRLRSIPDSVQEFTGFCKKRDLFGGDFLGYGPVNHYQAAGTAAVRNVWLPTRYRHGGIPDTKHLLKDPRMVAWIHGYQPLNEPITRPGVDQEFDGDSANLLWAAEVWYSIKKHWVLELQRAIRARRAAGGRP